jgi:hypothetical protein
MIRKVKSKGLLLNPERLYSFLDAATKSVTTDPDLASLNALRKLATSVKGMQTGQVRFVTVPTYTRSDGATVAWKDSANALWQAIRDDEPLPGEPDKKARGKHGRDKPLTVAPASVKVRVLNGSGTPGLAGTTAEELRRAGFDVVGVGNADRFDYGHSVVRHQGQGGAARTLSAAVPDSDSATAPTGGSALELVIGKDFHGVQQVEAGQKPPTSTPGPEPSIAARKASKQTCSS